ncbi:asparagine synthetase B [bacterium]|nr:MAG: asparagine synthetase B [bacterium]
MNKWLNDTSQFLSRNLVQLCLLIAALSFSLPVSAQKMLIPMDLKQNDHLKAYGIAFKALEKEVNVEWLLNYRGGSFMTNYSADIENDCLVRGVTALLLSASDVVKVYQTIAEENMEAILLEKAPRIAVYTPPDKKPWDDAVTMALEYAEIPYDKIFDLEVLQGRLADYDWLHLHHEDFTGQYGKFFSIYSQAPWYIQQQNDYEAFARQMGFATVSKEKLAVVRMMKDYIAKGGFLFAMCGATDSFDIALAAQNTDICESMYDGDPADPQSNSKLQYAQSLAFTGFRVEMNPYVYEFSDIDHPSNLTGRLKTPEEDYFTLFDFSAKYDPVPAMLTQNHVSTVKGFMGQTTGYKRSLIKDNIVIMGEDASILSAKYIHGNFGKGMFTFYGGHDPEDYAHAVGDPPTDLTLHKNSPGYRLILNNILFPAAKKKPQKT